MKKIIFCKVAGFYSPTLLNFNPITVYFNDFERGFHNSYFPEQVLVAASEKHILHF